MGVRGGWRNVAGAGLGAGLMLAAGCGRRPDAELQDRVRLTAADLFPAAVDVALPRLDPAAVVAEVDGRPITAGELDRETALRALALRGRLPPERIAQLQPRLGREALDGLVVKALLHGAAVEEQVAVGEAEVEEQIRRLREALPPGAVWEETLAANNLDKDSLRAQVASSLRLERLLQDHGLTGTPPTPEQVERHYALNRERFEQPETAEIRHILVRVDAAGGAAARQNALQQAERLLAEIRGGRPFEDVAREHSADAASRRQGGYLGRISRGALPPALEQAAFARDPGALGAPVETTFGFHLLRVESREPARPLTLDEVRETIAQRLTEESRQQALQEYIANLREKASVRITLPAF